MTGDTHPRYQNPTIQEAICEIQFRLPDAQQWEPSWYGDFFQDIQHEFPTFQPVAAQLQLRVGKPPSGVPVFSVPQLIRYQSRERPFLLQLSESTFSVNVLPEYPGWQAVKGVAASAWKRVFDVVRPEVITRIGLRYINRIERSMTGETLEAWITPNDYVPTAILRSQAGFASQCSIKIDHSNRLSVTIADQEPSPGSYGAFILDTDRAVESEMSPDIDLLLDKAEDLHDHVWQAFSAMKGDRLEKLLQGELV